MPLRHRFFIGSLLFALVGATPAFAQTKLSGQQIKAALSDHLVRGTTESGDTWEAIYGSDGSYSIRIPSKDWSDKGSWRQGSVWVLGAQIYLFLVELIAPG